MSGDPGHVDPSGLELDEEEYAEALQQQRVEGEEVTGQHGRGLGSKELVPGRTRPHRRRIDVVPSRNGPDARMSQNHAGPGQLTMYPSVAPGGVLTGQSEDHRSRSGGDAGRPDRWGWVHLRRTRSRCQRSRVSGCTKNRPRR